jgi:hypothetical protein
VPAEVGEIVHVTAVLLVLVSVAANCWVWPPYSIAVAGETVIVTGGVRVIVAVAVLVVSA